MTERKTIGMSRRALLKTAAATSAVSASAAVATATSADSAAGSGRAAVTRAAAAAAPARTADGKWTRIRRVVTSEDASGKGFVMADGEPTNAFEMNGTRIVRLWETPAVPAALPLKADAGITAANAYREGFRGTSFYVAELPGGARAPSIPMHRNATLDYMAILSGRIVFKMEDREIELGAGDTLVQGGNLHSWVNRWEEPCLLLFVVVTGTAG